MRSIGAAVITPSGAVDHGIERKPEELARILAAIDVEHELLSQAEASSRWPQLTFESSVLWHPGAGVIDAERSVQAMVSLATSNGANLLTNWDVSKVQKQGSGYRVFSADGSFIDAANIIVSAGGWLPQLLGQLELPARFLAGLPELTVRQEQAFHFRYRPEYAPETWPTLIHKSSDIEVYGLPGGRDAEFAG